VPRNQTPGTGWLRQAASARATRALPRLGACYVCRTLVEKIGGFRGEAKFTTWLCGITFNACRDLRRRRRSFSAFSERLAVIVGIAAAPDGRDLYDAIWIQSAISKLKPALRDTAVLVVGQQLNYAEAAVILGVAEPTVAWRMHEVRRILSKSEEREP
jgi:RNA polymerase sigma-70 factor (ECF subfamily)